MVWKVSLHEIMMIGLGVGSIYCGIVGISKLNSEVVDIIEWELMSLGSSLITFTVVFDWISLLFLSFVFLISSSVLFYSGSYMSGDHTFSRFMYLVLSFVASMSFMVLSPNLISILLGWDGLGLVSYALVIYYQNEKSANAGMLTVLSNRVGDVAILLSIGLMSMLGSWNFFLYSFYMDDENWLTFKLLLMLAAMTKSAQIPFSAWLPAAMAAPTPVSALVHSSTLVTAGVYLMIRFSPALEGSKVQSVLLIFSCTTMFMAGLGANFEYDLKKIIALSTLSQLGVMLSILSLGYTNLAFFHLLSHALFKALLFMCAGVVIHSVSDYQDIRCMGSLVNFMPVTVSYMTIANLALCGFPFLAGFYSKDLILEVAYMTWINIIALLLYILATGLTVMYTLRLIYYTLSGEFNLVCLSGVSDEDQIMVNSMSMLGMGAVLAGASLSWVLFPEPYMICMSVFMKSLTLLISGLGGFMGYMLNMMNTVYKLKSMNNYNIVVFSGSMWFMPLLSSLKNSEISFLSGGFVSSMGDKGWYEFFGAQGIYFMLYKMFMILNNFQLNSVKVFMKMFIISVIIILFLYI
uniref:NADH-ubiquinone oxidoreductase chain 5 n=1 Tax=Carpilius maculatus TaxID=205348 RepID=A0A7D3UPV9_9EUCA|nr:NADH dehydrogenase subunit 5 [Carpilius maculatus]QKE42636.1 NADH dehydrogenase subunit 5 [Carpilius maculatus]